MNDKWKTFPCKTCILKGICTIECFEWPTLSDHHVITDRHVVERYIEENDLQHTCLSCGNKNNDNYENTFPNAIQWNCEKCNPYYTES